MKNRKNSAVQESIRLLDKLSQHQPLTRVERLRLHGYICVHLWGDWYLVRNYSINRKRFSTYRLSNLKETSDE
jgi:hypothetical protein